MRLIKWFIALLFTFVVAFSLSACDSSLVKPTGLEVQDDQYVQNNEEPEEQQLELDKSKDESEAIDQSEVIDTDDSNEVQEDIKEDQQEADQVKKESGQVTSDPKTTAKKNKVNEQTKPPVQSTGKGGKETGSSDSTKKSQTSKPVDTQQKPKPENKPPANDIKETPVKEKEEPKQTKSMITYSIVISGSEVPLSPTKMEIKDEDTVLQALIQITMANKIHMDYRGGQGATAYIQGMGNVYEFDRGQGSGWMYRVNGIFPDRGAGVVPLCDGDIVEWLYTTNLGQDLGADLKPVRRDGKCPK